MRLDAMAARLLLRWRSRSGPLARVVRRPARPKIPTPKVGEVRVAAVQMPFTFFSSGEAFARELRSYVRQASEAGAELVVFPEDLGTTLLEILPGFDRLARSGSLEGALASLGPGVNLSDVIEMAGPATLRIYETVLAGLARSHRVHVQGGSILVPLDGRTFNVAHLYDPDGRLLGRQPKCHLLPLEASWGLAAGDDLEVLDTPLGKLAQPVCMDATYFETFRILVSKGAEIVCLPTADPDPAPTAWKSLRGLWPRVQESGVYGIQAAMVGEALGMSFAGQSAIIAPIDLTPDGSGYLARAQGHEREVVISDLDLEALRALHEHPAVRPNPAFDESYFPDIYRGFWRGGILHDDA